MADDYSQLMSVKIEPHVAVNRVMTPVGPVDDQVEFDQYQVFVEGERIASFNLGNPKLMVGIIGKQPGANFCPIAPFYKFVAGQRKWIAEQAKKLHGKASPEPFVEVPPPQ